MSDGKKDWAEDLEQERITMWRIRQDKIRKHCIEQLEHASPIFIERLASLPEILQRLEEELSTTGAERSDLQFISRILRTLLSK